MANIFSKLFGRKDPTIDPGVSHNKDPKEKEKETVPSPGRVSVPEDGIGIITWLNKEVAMVKPSFDTELIPLLRKLYKVNPDMSIAVADMFKLANTGHSIAFPNNTPEEANEMIRHLRIAGKSWAPYTAGTDGLVNKFIVQLLVSGAISFESVPNNSLTGLKTIVLVNPESIRFKRDSDGAYSPYQFNPYLIGKDTQYIKLNPATYKYIAMFNDTDEPNGIPPFLAALDSIKGQHDMRVNLKHIMELMGMAGFLEAKMAKPERRPNESPTAYSARQVNLLRELKTNLHQGMKDGIVTGFIDDHEFKLNSTTKELGNISKPWDMNQQAVANGLGVSGTIIGVNGTTTDTGTSIMLSKMISQLRNIQLLVTAALEFIYDLELRLAGYNNKGIKITFSTTTIADELKVQQGIEYKLRNLTTLYNQGIIDQDEYARSAGYDKPAEKGPREVIADTSTGDAAAQKQKREKDKDTSDRKTRDKNNPTPKRRDQDPRPTGN